MAVAGPAEESVLEGELTCPVCLDLFSDPHLLPCGHNLCLACVRGLRRRAERGRFRCPECRESLRCSGPLQKNYRLANIAEDYRRRGRPCRQAPPPPPPPVHCDYCSPGDAALAVKTCLQCEVSMCGEHVKPHLERPAFREHPLTEPLGDVRDRKCPAHDEMYRYYCVDERVCVCNACTIEGRHTGHTIKTLKNTMKDLKESLQMQMQKLSRKISRTEKFLQQRADAERDSHRFVEGAEQHMRVVGDLLQAQSSLQALLQENDPFHFLQEYHSTGKKLRKALKRPLFSPGSVCLDTEGLADVMEAKLEEFQAELRLQVTELIHTVCVETNGEEEEEGHEEEEVEEEELEEEEGG
ncbi:hypothetical protein SKAU_G00032990 [Synaphobranchus kaupii]|uniref:Uncharacterized protein n=1 Tax=Synaphobranchus kaupii TaxID=118154 RepID=A0A9Q1GFD2_SYNKA|nr:hypothetical protein SKAU_G00032990 [Synaphobranchus kaupii]